jgi:hypothetical protein
MQETWQCNTKISSFVRSSFALCLWETVQELPRTRQNAPCCVEIFGVRFGLEIAGWSLRMRSRAFPADRAPRCGITGITGDESGRNEDGEMPFGAPSVSLRGSGYTRQAGKDSRLRETRTQPQETGGGIARLVRGLSVAGIKKRGAWIDPQAPLFYILMFRVPQG